MKVRTRAPLAIATLAFLALSACDSATESFIAPEGSVTFSFAGDDTGAYDATGGFDRQRPGSSAFAVGSRGFLQNGTEAMIVLSHVPRANDANVADEFLLTLENPAVGTVTCAADAENCSFSATFFIGATRTGATDVIYTSVSGTVSITSLNEDRVRGTFTLEMESVVEEGETPRTTAITNGTFDVPLVANLG